MWTYFYSQHSPLSLTLQTPFKAFCNTLSLDDKRNHKYITQYGIHWIPALVDDKGTVFQGKALYTWIQENTDQQPAAVSAPPEHMPKIVKHAVTMGVSKLELEDDGEQPQAFQNVKLKSNNENIRAYADQMAKEREDI